MLGNYSFIIVRIERYLETEIKIYLHKQLIVKNFYDEKRVYILQRLYYLLFKVLDVKSLIIPIKEELKTI